MPAFSFSAEQDLSPSSGLAPEYRLTNIRANFLYGTYFAGEVASGAIAWVPEVRFTDRWSTKALVGISLLKNADRDKPVYFAAPEIQLLTGFRVFAGLAVEAGGGYQKWITADGSIYPLLSVNLLYQFSDKRVFGIVDNVFFGYSALYNILVSDQYKIGLQISW